MFATEKELNYFKNAIKEIGIDDIRLEYQSDYESFLKIKQSDYQLWSEDTLEDLTNDIIKDNDFLDFILRLVNSNSGIDLNKPYRLSIDLLDSKDSYDLKKCLVSLEFCFESNNEFFSEKFNWIWN